MGSAPSDPAADRRSRARTLGLRFLAAERNDVLDQAARTRWQTFLRDRLLATGYVPWRTIPALNEEIDALGADAVITQASVVAELRSWVDRRSQALGR